MQNLTDPTAMSAFYFLSFSQVEIFDIKKEVNSSCQTWKIILFVAGKWIDIDSSFTVVLTQKLKISDSTYPFREFLLNIL